jgi:hypothetical protein
MRRIALMTMVAIGVSACGGGSGNSAAKQTAAVTTAYTTFFNASTPAPTALTFLQNGGSYSAQLAQLYKLMPKTLTAKVESVKVTGNTAAVTYELISAGKSLLGHPSTGTAVQVSGKWFVSATTFCGLATLAGAACSG